MRATGTIFLAMALAWGCGGDDEGRSVDGGVTAVDGAAVDGAVEPDGGAVVEECTIFPDDNPWNTDISGLPVHADSDTYIASIGLDDHLHANFGTVWEGAPNGMPYVEVTADTPKVTLEFMYAEESDPGPYPIPDDVPIEGGPDSQDDRHIILLDRESCILYELSWAWPPGGYGNPFADSWYAGSGAIFDLRSNDLRPDSWTSADAAGLPIFPGLVRYDEVMDQGEINHALRFTVERTQRAYMHPATHYASTDTDPALPPMGLRVRMRADFDISVFSAEVQVIFRALKRYGMFVADNGSDWFICGAPNPRWNDDHLHELHDVSGSAFEVVDTGEAIIR